MATLDTMIVRRLATEIRAGLFEHPRTITPIDAAAGGKVARRVAEQGFAKVYLRPRERRHVRLALDRRAFAMWDSAGQQRTTVTGRYRVSVGDSSRDLPLSAPVNIRASVITP